MIVHDDRSDVQRSHGYYREAVEVPARDVAEFGIATEDTAVEEAADLSAYFRHFGEHKSLR